MARAIVPLHATPALIERKIHVIRGQRVMLDSDLAELYRVSTMAPIKRSGETANGSRSTLRISLRNKSLRT
jgi:ORF6N domain